MGVPTRKERFTQSKCDRCGKATAATVMGDWDLFTLLHEWGDPCADQGDFCQPCISTYSADDWARWVAKREKTAHIRTLAREYLELITLSTDPSHEVDARRELSSQRGIVHDQLIEMLGPGHERDVFDMQAYCRQVVAEKER